MEKDIFFLNLPLFFLFVDAKRLIGRKFEDATVQADMKHWPFDVVSDGGKPKIQVDYKGEKKSFFPEEVCYFSTFNLNHKAMIFLLVFY